MQLGIKGPATNRDNSFSPMFSISVLWLLLGITHSFKGSPPDNFQDLFQNLFQDTLEEKSLEDETEDLGITKTKTKDKVTTKTKATVPPFLALMKEHESLLNMLKKQDTLEDLKEHGKEKEIHGSWVWRPWRPFEMIFSWSIDRPQGGGSVRYSLALEDQGMKFKREKHIDPTEPPVPKEPGDF